MKCPACAAMGQNSRIEILPSGTTAMPEHSYFDEDGNYHHHNPNTQGSLFRCSEGHKFSRLRESPCPAGDFGDEEWTIKVFEADYLTEEET